MSDPYTAERGTPTVPACGNPPLTLEFTGTHLIFRASSATITFPAVSGRAVYRPDPATGKFTRATFDYGVDRQKVKGVGPIPEGRYWVNPGDLWKNAFYKVWAPTDAWGNYRLTIHPYPDTETYGRGGFFIHGGATPGSAGCIDLTSAMDDFVTWLKKEAGGGANCYIALRVKYPGV